MNALYAVGRKSAQHIHKILPGHRSDLSIDHDYNALPSTKNDVVIGIDLYTGGAFEDVKCGAARIDNAVIDVYHNAVGQFLNKWFAGGYHYFSHFRSSFLQRNFGYLKFRSFRREGKDLREAGGVV